MVGKHLGATERLIRELYVRDGRSTYEIGATFGMDRQEVSRQLKRMGVEVAARGSGRPRQCRRIGFSASEAGRARILYLQRRLTTEEIGRQLGVSAHTVRRLLREGGVAVRTRGWANREDRVALRPASVERLYLMHGLTADEVARQLRCARNAVLRLAHERGWPVRVGGPPPSTGPQEIMLIRALHADPVVRAALKRHRIRRVPPGGPIWERFPRPVELTTCALRDLYQRCGLATTHIELLTGWPAMTIRHRLKAAGTQLRPPGGRSPFMRRWRASQLATATLATHHAAQPSGRPGRQRAA